MTHEGIWILFFGHLGAKVMVARNAFEGLEAIKNTHPDLVLSDIKMPGMDGFELLDEIRALGPDAGGSVPVIAMSAFFRRQIERACITQIFGHAFRSHSLQTN
jgi:CheY-like chemotaxis protein